MVLIELVKYDVGFGTVDPHLYIQFLDVDVAVTYREYSR